MILIYHRGIKSLYVGDSLIVGWDGILGGDRVTPMLVDKITSLLKASFATVVVNEHNSGQLTTIDCYCYLGNFVLLNEYGIQKGDSITIGFPILSSIPGELLCLT